jgi:DNA replication protein
MTGAKGFPGFPEGRQRVVPLPGAFFSELLPTIDDLTELKVTLHAFWILSRMEGALRALRREDFAADSGFMQGLATPERTAEDALDGALEHAVSRGTLLKASLASDAGTEDFYFLNSAKGRAAQAGLERGTWRPSEDPGPDNLSIDRPNIFRLYEQNIGPLTPMIAETLREAEDTYPQAWIEDALRIAVENNVRKWRYVEAILEDWRTRGRDEREDRGDSEKARRRYVEGEFADYVEH